MNDRTTQTTDIELLAVHGVAVKKAGAAGAVADLLGRDADEVAAALDAAAAQGRLLAARGTYMVTPDGRAWLDEQYPIVFASFRADPEATAAYERFERVNRELLTLFTDWQMIQAGGERIANDHTDADYDARIIDRLGELHERSERPLARFAALDERLGQYPRRLEIAYDRVLAGASEYVSGARVDSYHTIWFELHEDLLRMLGREREVYE
jgi:hypothetical protein